MFAAQLRSPPDTVEYLESEAVKKVVPDSGHWCQLADLEHADPSVS
jgi:hypothetical protein